MHPPTPKQAMVARSGGVVLEVIPMTVHKNA